MYLKIPIKPALLLICVFVLTAFKQDDNRQSNAKSYRVGKANIVVEAEEKEGEFGTFTAKTFRLEKLYKQDGRWKKTNLFNEKELLQMRAAIDKAIHEEVVITED